MSIERAEFDERGGSASFYEMVDLFKGVLLRLGEDPDREGLQETPKRIAKAWLEMTAGLDKDPTEHLKKQFTTKSDSMVVVKDIPFTSMCEHHFLSFAGKAHIGYVPGKSKKSDGEFRIAGLSKFARVVEEFAARPQVQENLTNQVAKAIWKTLKPQGVIVVMEASHSCMSLRGVKSTGSVTLTSSVYGLFDENKDGIKDEFLHLIRS